MAKINIDFKLQNDIDIAFNDSATIDLDFGFDAVYTGAYEVGSSLDEQVIQTANKRMMKDIVIDPLPTSKMTNPSGGYTVKIGK